MSAAPQTQPSGDTFGNAIGSIAQAARNKARALLDSADRGEALSQPASPSASVASFNIQTGGNGTGTAQQTQYTAGVTITASAMITSPPGSTKYTGNVAINYNNQTIHLGPLAEGQASPTYKIETSFFHDTTFTINLVTTPALPNTTVKCALTYSL